MFLNGLRKSVKDLVRIIGVSKNFDQSTSLI
jgi:hypothetical protein